MAVGRIKLIAGEDRVDGTTSRLVTDGQVIEVPEEQVYSYTQQVEVWEPADDETQRIHDDAHAEYLERTRPATPPGELAAPAGNASREEWANYVLDAGLATEEDLEGKGRDEIRDTYRTQEG